MKLNYSYYRKALNKQTNKQTKTTKVRLGGGGGGKQGRRAPDTVFVKYHPPLSLTDVNQTTELPWIQRGFSSSGV